MDNFSKLLTEIGETWAKNSTQYLVGARQTILLAVVATAIGCLIGFLCGVLQTIPVQKHDNVFKKVLLAVVRAVIRVYVEVFRGTPMILQAVFIYFGVPYFFGTDNIFQLLVDSVNGAFGRPVLTLIGFVSYFVVSVNTGAYMAETVRGGILSIDPGQTEGAKAIGMTHLKTMLHVILPQMFRNIIPQIGNNLIVNIKDTSVMFIIGYTELFAVHKGVVGSTYVYFPSAVIEMIMYLAMTVICSVILRLLERKLDGPENFDVTTADSLAHTSGMTTYVKKKEKEELR